jgi:non-canonical (house-cleaning) NTP pyrophosphatase
MMAFAWVFVRSRHLAGQGRTGAFFLPEPVADLVRQGKELGEADDIVFGRSNSKQQEGAIGILSGKVIDREQFYVQAIMLALLPFKNVDLYSEQASDPPF